MSLSFSVLVLLIIFFFVLVHYLKHCFVFEWLLYLQYVAANFNLCLSAFFFAYFTFHTHNRCTLFLWNSFTFAIINFFLFYFPFLRFFYIFILYFVCVFTFVIMKRKYTSICMGAPNDFSNKTPIFLLRGVSTRFKITMQTNLIVYVCEICNPQNFFLRCCYRGCFFGCLCCFVVISTHVCVCGYTWERIRNAIFVVCPWRYFTDKECWVVLWCKRGIMTSRREVTQAW